MSRYVRTVLGRYFALIMSKQEEQILARAGENPKRKLGVTTHFS